MSLEIINTLFWIDLCVLIGCINAAILLPIIMLIRCTEARIIAKVDKYYAKKLCQKKNQK